MSTDLSSPPAPGPSLSGAQVGSYTLGALRWRLRLADAYQATGPDGSATVFIVHARFASLPGVTDAITRSVAHLATLAEDKHLVRAREVYQAHDQLAVVADDVVGTSAAELIARKAGQGVGVRGTANLIGGVAAALAAAGSVHGSLAPESVVVGKSGRIHLIDVALGPATALAIRHGAAPGGLHIAPEVTGGTSITAASDVWGLGALCYEVLTGRPLAAGGPRPSEAAPGAPPAIDGIITRACHADPAARVGSVLALRELVADALGAGAGDEAGPARALASASGAIAPSLAERVSNPGIAIPSAAAVDAADAATPAAAAEAPVDRVLAAALADGAEKWLITKGRFDYGPFSLADVVAQIGKGDILAGHVVVDKDSGARMDVGEHPQLAPLVEQARIARDHARRAQAEVVHQSREKRRSVTLMAMIGAGVLAAAGVVYLIISTVRSSEKAKVASVSSVGEATLKVTISQPKRPPKRSHGGGGGGGGGKPRTDTGGAIGGGDLTLDLSGDDDEGSETLDMNTIYGVYSRYGGQLGGCLSREGGGSANISIVIEGKSGKVTWLRVNDQASGGLHGCISRVMRGMKFPTINGPRSRAEFDISL